ncbi:hypothetical protein [Actinosynnema mirum]|uniref:Uncharacterized protein n=1 Tax=Actinosynnema mirum (strain ATCC 29888 / DSM 43827 / JCM 3225 / NBRC 14064 / NCIMB 13271 / NRRL B-12336 / IMRU 3971 / 101) TaxID=446462 RepID=C6WN50_ACTMD|nr:hypothetical protein [Actinosynnema mirum]ACU38563.1 hypothetical protein Amir_4733 [Actinosynnema mirum DSM 43827]
MGNWNVVSTCALLCTLLERDDYRRRWARKSGRGGGGLDQTAIAKVLAKQRVEDGEISEERWDAHRVMKDPVRRMVRRERLTGKTLALFIRAFDIAERDQDLLWDTFAGGGFSVGIVNTIRERPRLAVPQRHRTISVSERYRIGTGGVPVSRNVRQALRAVGDGVGSYTFGHEREVAEVTVRHGGFVGPQHEYGDGLHATEIILERPLRAAETTALEYEATYSAGSESFTEVRRAAYGRSENVDIAVEFADRFPGQAWWCVWEELGRGNPVHEERIDCRNGAIWKYFPALENAVVGVRWQC